MRAFEIGTVASTITLAIALSGGAALGASNNWMRDYVQLRK